MNVIRIQAGASIEVRLNKATRMTPMDNTAVDVRLKSTDEREIGI
jgi:hypothetical protein